MCPCAQTIGQDTQSLVSELQLQGMGRNDNFDKFVILDKFDKLLHGEERVIDILLSGSSFLTVGSTFSPECMMNLSPPREKILSGSPATPAVAIAMKGVKKQFLDYDDNEVDVIKDISLDIYHQEFISIVGPSGCGKTTMFNIIAGLLPPTAGEIQVFDPYYALPGKGRVGYMLQKDLLFPWRSILDNVCLGLEISEMPKKERHERAMTYLEKYGLGDFAHAYPATLSGGMRQRAALIRTLVIEPDIILLDEPFSALDYQTRLVLEEEILTVLKEYGKTVVLITHDIGEAIAMSDRIAVMSQRPTWNKKTYEIGLARRHGSAMGARKDPEFQSFFDAIWADMDIQLGEHV